MDKQTFGSYGYLVAVVLVVAIMISFATPFGTHITEGVKNLVAGPDSAGQGTLDNLKNDLTWGDAGEGENLYPTVLEGDGQTVNQFAFNQVQFRSLAPADTLKEVKVNGEVVDPDNYIVTEGSTIITFKNEYVESLALGINTVDVVSNNVTSSGSFTVINIIPEGGLYIDVDGNEYSSGEDFPATPKLADTYYYGDYQYHYGYIWCGGCEEWSDSCGDFPQINGWAARVIDDTKSEYDNPLTSINGDTLRNLASLFAYCANLTKAPIIPFGVTDIRGIFEGCAKLETYTGSVAANGDFSGYIIPEGVTKMQNAFGHCSALTSLPVLPDSMTTVDGFYGCTSLRSVVIPAGITAIANSAFSGCTALERVEIPSSVTRIEPYAFATCTSLKTIVIPETVEYIGTGAFQNSTSLTELVLPAGVTIINDSVFSDCTSLNSITIQGDLKSIGALSFLRCASLENIIFKGTLAQWTSVSKSTSFGNTWNFNTGNYTIYCVDGTVAKDGTITYN